MSSELIKPPINDGPTINDGQFGKIVKQFQQESMIQNVPDSNKTAAKNPKKTIGGRKKSFRKTNRKRKSRRRTNRRRTNRRR